MLQSRDARRTPASAPRRSPSCFQTAVRAARCSPVSARRCSGRTRPRRRCTAAACSSTASEGPRRPQHRLRRAPSRSRSAATTRSTPTSDRRGASTTSRRPRSRGRTAPSDLADAHLARAAAVRARGLARRAAARRRRREPVAARARADARGSGSASASVSCSRSRSSSTCARPATTRSSCSRSAPPRQLEVRRHVRGDLPPLRHALLLAPVLFGPVQPVLPGVHAP